MKQKILAFLFTIAAIIMVTANVKGVSQNNSIEDEENKASENQKELDSIQALLKELNASKNDIDIYMDKLRESYNAISEYILELNDQIEEKQAQIDEINEELDLSYESSELQYEAMKLRIQYMYEQGKFALMNAFFSDYSISEILNKMEYSSNLVEYDREKLLEYERTRVYIEATKDKLEKEIEDIQKLVSEQEKRQIELNQVMEEAVLTLRAKEAEIDEAESRAEQAAIEIQKSKDTIEELKAEESRRVAESERLSILYAQGNGEYPTVDTSDYVPTEKELNMVAAVMYCEARGEPYEGIIAVGTVIMNRVADPRFPNTIEEVLMAPNQFTCVQAGYYAAALAKGSNETCMKAAREVLYGGVRNGNWLYFRTINGIVQGDEIGHHVFYYR